MIYITLVQLFQLLKLPIRVKIDIDGKSDILSDPMAKDDDFFAEKTKDGLTITELVQNNADIEIPVMTVPQLESMSKKHRVISWKPLLGL